MKRIELIDTTGPIQREVGIVEFLKEPLTSDADFKCSGPQKITLDQAQKIQQDTMKTSNHGGKVMGKVDGLTGIEWRL